MPAKRDAMGSDVAGGRSRSGQASGVNAAADMSGCG